MLVFILALTGAVVVGVAVLNDTGELTDDEVAELCDERVADRLGAHDPSFDDEVRHCIAHFGFGARYPAQLPAD